MRKLNPPKYKRQITPRCCATCKHNVPNPPFHETVCERDGSLLSGDGVDAIDQYWCVCDYWKEG